MIIIISGLLLLLVLGYIAAPFAAKHPRAQFNVSAEQRDPLERAIELEIRALSKREEQASLQAEE